MAATTTMMAITMMTIVPDDMAFLPGSVFESDLHCPGRRISNSRRWPLETRIGPPGRNRAGRRRDLPVIPAAARRRRAVPAAARRGHRFPDAHDEPEQPDDQR